MALPGNGIFVVKGEMTILMAALKRGTRWTSHSYQDEEIDDLHKNFQDLKEILSKINDLRHIEPTLYLNPFLDVIKSEETTGQVTSLALAAINKFLCYGLIDPTHSTILHTVYNIADAVTHARFVGTDQSSDGVVLMRILQVLRTLTLAPEGSMLTDESLCEIMLSCFRICFETRIHELLRRTAENYLKDMVQLIFMRLPQFSDDPHSISGKNLQMRSKATIEQTKLKKKSRHSFRKKSHAEEKDKSAIAVHENEFKGKVAEVASPRTPDDNVVDVQNRLFQTKIEVNIGKDETSDTIKSSHLDSNTPGSAEIEKQQNEKDDQNPSTTNQSETTISEMSIDTAIVSQAETTEKHEIVKNVDENDTNKTSKEYVNQRGIKFTLQLHDDVDLSPYGLACVRELLRFLISLCNPHDKQNTDIMMQAGLTLLTVAFEVGADSIGKHSALLSLVKDDLCRNLFSLLNTERISIFATNLQVSFLMFESLRSNLKFQMEKYLTKLIEIVGSENQKITYEHKEIALDNILHLWRIPGFVNELYLNYDCDMHCTNLYEDLTKLLAKNAFSITNGVWHTHLLSLDALLTVIESIDTCCLENKTTEDPLKTKSENDSNEKFESINNIIENNSRIKYAETVPLLGTLLERKNIKKWLPQGTEFFNNKPKKGIQFLQEHNVLAAELNPLEIALFLRENSGLDKKMIGEYIGSRNNLDILDAFVKTFNFTGIRIDEALRSFLETFRLPGEAPTISLIMENFAQHWHKSNGEPFADVDAAFTLAYAVIMLNVDQHNENAKKQTIPMSDKAFKKNLKGVNGGADFDEKMLDEIYNTIKNDEIIMPAEQSGLVKENYLWKVLLRKGASKDGTYYHISRGTYDSELFRIIYGPIVTALCAVYEKSEDPSLYKHIMNGFEKCANVAAHFGMFENLDMLVLSLCKFTVFYKQGKQNNIMITFGSNQKAQLAVKSVFSLIHLHGDNIREGWKHIFDLILSLYSNNLLPKSYIETEDFIDSRGKIILAYEETPAMQKQDTSLFSSLYSYMVSTENLSKVPSPEEQLFIDASKECLKNCNLDQLITDSKFLHEDSLTELIQVLIELSKGPDIQKNLGYSYNETVTVFFMELLFKIVIQNRDRVIVIWQLVRDHIYSLVIKTSLFDYQFLLERSVIGLLRIAIRLMRNEDMCPIVIQSLRMLLLLKSNTLCRISKQISFGLYELLKTSAQNIHTTTDWTIIFTLLECVGAGAPPPKPVVEQNANLLDQGTKSDDEHLLANSDDDESVASDRGYTSDTELVKNTKMTASSQLQSPLLSVSNSPTGTPNMSGWILVGNEDEIQPVIGRTVPPTQYGITMDISLGPHDPESLIKCCESLAFLVRDVAHITPYNFDICVHCIRIFVESSLQEPKKSVRKNRDIKELKSKRKILNRRKTDIQKSTKNIQSSPDDSSDEDDDFPSGYHHLLLDLMHTLHTRTAQIFKWWAEEGGEIAEETSLWTQGWCPLLQGIARMCCDRRDQVRISAIAFLQRALLVHDLQMLSGPEWEQCFHRVLFPLLSYLLQPINPKEPIAMAEFRNRAATVLSKVFLHHLTPLLSLHTFAKLWFTILDFMQKYMFADKSDILYEAIPELLKNMLLVMDSAKVFDGPEGKTPIWHATWERVGTFLPNLRYELFKESQTEKSTEEAALPGVPCTKSITSIQHNIENLTRSSIILQPPVSQQQVSSHLFAHLGQMVSTPIGSSSYYATPVSLSTSTTSSFSSTSTVSNPPLFAQAQLQTTTSSILQPTLQPGMPYMPNLLTNIINTVNQSGSVSVSDEGEHSFPVLYSSPSVIPSTTATEVQPLSLYSDYIGNPYNNVQLANSAIEEQCETSISQIRKIEESSFQDQLIRMQSKEEGEEENSQTGYEPTLSPKTEHVVMCEPAAPPVLCDSSVTNFFQSANYFNTTEQIPSGSEILFGISNTNTTNPMPTVILNQSKTSDV